MIMSLLGGERTKAIPQPIDWDPYAANQQSQGQGIQKASLAAQTEYIMPSKVTVTKHMEKPSDEKKNELKVKLERADKLWPPTAGQFL